MNTLLIIDAQNDFVLPEGALPVPGAVEDMQRLILFIKEHKPDKIILTMDSHSRGHIATQEAWEDQNLNPPPPYTAISCEDASKSIWRAKANREAALSYLKELEARGKTHTIWPEHCVYLSEGWKLYKELKDAIDEWIYAEGGELSVHLKGQALDTEMFSAVMPEVYGKNDEKRAERFLSLFDKSDKICVAGEAENFCVKETVKDIVRLKPELAPKLIILRDCMSAIPAGDDIDAFWAEMQAKGVTVTGRQ